MDAQCTHDLKADVLYVTFRRAKVIVCIDGPGCVLTRVDPEKDEVVGFTIMPFGCATLTAGQFFGVEDEPGVHELVGMLKAYRLLGCSDATVNQFSLPLDGRVRMSEALREAMEPSEKETR